MAEPPPFQEGIQQMYDSALYYDLKVQVSPLTRKPSRKSVDDAHIRCHRVVLAAGSNALSQYFQSNPDLGRIHRVFDLSDVFSAPEEVNRAVIRYIYGLPLFDEEEVSEENTASSDRLRLWKDLCRAAEGFGIPSLHTLAVDKYRQLLEQLLSDTAHGLPGDKRYVAQFLGEAEAIYKADNVAEKSASAQSLIAKLCCKHFTNLSKLNSFGLFSEEYPKLLRGMVDYAARHGDGAFGQ